MAKKNKFSSVWYLSAIATGILLFALSYINFESLFSIFSKTTDRINNVVNKGSNQLDIFEATESASPSASPTPTPIPITFSPSSAAGIPILTYHFVANNPNPQDKARDNLSVPPDKFEEQMKYLSENGFTTISLDTLYSIFNGQATRPAKPVVLTFDDGYIDFYTNAFPILKRLNLHAVSFIPVGLIGGSYYMNWSQIKEIQSSGLITFEAHSVSHSNLTSLNHSATLKQLVDSKKILSEQTGYPVNFVAYPYGINNDIVQKTAKEVGFIGGLGTWIGKSSGIGMNMPRIKVSGFWSISEFASRL